MTEMLEVGSVAELDDLVKRGLIHDDDATRVARNNLASREYLAANPSLVQVHREPTGPMTTEEVARARQDFINDCTARGIEPTLVSFNVSGESTITIGRNGEIIAKDGQAVLSAPTSAAN